jgi:hypothetical protein
MLIFLPNGLFLQALHLRFLHVFLASPIGATLRVHVICFDFMLLLYFSPTTYCYKGSNNLFIKRLHSMLFPRIKPVLKPPSQSVFFPYIERPSFTPIQNKRKTNAGKGESNGTASDINAVVVRFQFRPRIEMSRMVGYVTLLFSS